MTKTHEEVKNKNVLVTGGAGAIGTNLVEKLLDLEVNHIYVIDDLSSGQKNEVHSHDKVTFYEGSISDEKILNEVFKNKIDLVFHLAALFANQNSIDNPEKDLDTNVVGTLKLLVFSKNHGVERFVYFNTSCMYKPASGVFREDSVEFCYETPYSISKHAGELYVRIFNDHYKLPTVSLRIFNSYGPHEYSGLYRNVIPNFFNKAMKGEALTVMGTGNETRSFTFVSDIINGVLLAATSEKAVGKIFNIGSNREVKIIDLAEKINKITGNTTPVKFIPLRDWDKTKRRAADLTKAESVLGYAPKVDIDEGLEMTYKWIKNLK
jgi:UDP-glucose 4-epimerase